MRDASSLRHPSVIALSSPGLLTLDSRLPTRGDAALARLSIRTTVTTLRGVALAAAAIGLVTGFDGTGVRWAALLEWSGLALVWVGASIAVATERRAAAMLVLAAVVLQTLWDLYVLGPAPSVPIVLDAVLLVMVGRAAHAATVLARWPDGCERP